MAEEGLCGGMKDGVRFRVGFLGQHFTKGVHGRFLVGKKVPAVGFTVTSQQRCEKSGDRSRVVGNCRVLLKRAKRLVRQTTRSKEGQSSTLDNEEETYAAGSEVFSRQRTLIGKTSTAASWVSAY